MTLHACPDCGAWFPEHPGPVHRYLGASAGCWAMFSAWLVGEGPSDHDLAGSRPSSAAGVPVDAPPGIESLVMDAYAAQHHGVPSPQAIQSVAVHLLVLHGVLSRRQSPSRALWIRQRALRQRGVFHWLTPPADTRAISFRHIFPSGSAPACTAADYVASVYESWAHLHRAQLDAWYDASVEGER